jgi:hypothetical protein
MKHRRFDSLYQQHLNALSLQGKSASTIDVYARAVPPSGSIVVQTGSVSNNSRNTSPPW